MVRNVCLGGKVVKTMRACYRGNPPLDRRRFLQLGGGLAVAGIGAWPRPAPGHAMHRPARSCILVYLLGGPPHLDMWDLKPEAPSEIRGPFQPIATSVPGLSICEHLPKLAQRAHQYALVRSVSHPNHNHTPMIYYTLTGRPVERPAEDNDVRPPLRDDFPHIGAVVASRNPAPGGLPGFVAIPEVAVRSSTAGEFKRVRSPLRGGGAGFLGAPHDPFNINDDPGSDATTPSLGLPDNLSAERLEHRVRLLNLIEGTGGQDLAPHHELRNRAIMLTGASGRMARRFSLADEPPALLDQYGRHRFGRALVLARRLVEAGVPMIAVHWNEMTLCDGWDTHAKNFEALETELLPMLDLGLSALLDDLESRGLLHETLVVLMGEFGRSPRINENAGRDHWGSCQSILMAGGGVRGGTVIGASDRIGAYPTENPVDPVDVHATIYRAMGIQADQEMHDPLGRPHRLCTGRAIEGVLWST